MSLNILPEDQIKVSLPTIGFIAPDTAFPIVVDFLAATGQKVAHVEVLDIPIGNGKTIQLTPSKSNCYCRYYSGVNSWSCWDRTLYGK